MKMKLNNSLRLQLQSSSYHCSFYLLSTPAAALSQRRPLRILYGNANLCVNVNASASSGSSRNSRLKRKIRSVPLPSSLAGSSSSSSSSPTIMRKPLHRFGSPTIIYSPLQQGSLPYPNFESELAQLLQILPKRIRRILTEHEEIQDLVEIVMDLGRRPLARFPSGDWIISDDPVTFHDLEYAISLGLYDVMATFIPPLGPLQRIFDSYGDPWGHPRALIPTGSTTGLLLGEQGTTPLSIIFRGIYSSIWHFRILLSLGGPYDMDILLFGCL